MPIAPENRHAGFEALSKPTLQELADELILQEASAIDRCVNFVLAETRGLWHGRARAMMCRRLKHCTLGQSQGKALLACICNRLVEGTFAEQFKDQLRLAMHIDLEVTLAAARQCIVSPKAHVQRYAKWVLLPEHAAQRAAPGSR